MKIKANFWGLIIIVFFIFSSCFDSQENKKNPTKKDTDDKQMLLQSEHLGLYHGIQPEYYLKNREGNEIIINEKKIPIPSSDLKFLIKTNDAVSLEQTNLEDNSQVFYEGATKIIYETSDILKLLCSFSDGKSSNPSYLLVINKSKRTAICIGNNEPEFELKKIK